MLGQGLGINDHTQYLITYLRAFMLHYMISQNSYIFIFGKKNT